MLRRFALIAFILTLALAACGGSDTPPPGGDTPAPFEQTASPARGNLTLCTTTEPESLLAPGADEIWAIAGMAATRSDGAFGAQAALLEALPSEADGTLTRNPDATLTATLHYRADFAWSDGQPFSVDDALLGFEVAALPELLSTKKVDGTTLEITLAATAGYPYVPDAPALPAHIIGSAEEAASSAYAGLLDPALGPYVMTGWQRGDSMTFAANPEYPDPPSIGNLTLGIVPDAATLAADLQSGACEVALDGLAVDALTAGQAQAIPGDLWEHLDFNTAPPGERVPYFADERVRQAVAQAINRAALAQLAAPDFAPLDSWLSPDHWAYPAAGVVAYPYDPNAAQSLLAAAGWTGGDTLTYNGAGGQYTCQRGIWEIEAGTPFNVTLLTPAGDDLRAAMAAQIQSDLGAVGISVTVETPQPESLFAADGPLTRRQFDMALYAWAGGPEPRGDNLWLGADIYRHPLTNEPAHDWQVEDRFHRATIELLGPNNIPSTHNDFRGQNVTGWCDEQSNLALVEATRTTDLTARREAYARQQAVFTQQVPALPLVARSRIVGHITTLCGPAPGPHAPVAWNVNTWYFDESGACAG